MTPRPQPTDKSGATVVLKNELTLQERSLHYYLHLNLSGMFYRSHSVCGMLILWLTGNRIRCTPILSLHYYYTHKLLKSKRFFRVFYIFIKNALNFEKKTQAKNPRFARIFQK